MQNEPILTPLSLSDTPARCAFAQCRMPSVEHGTCLVISFEADTEAGAEGYSLGNYAFMEAMIAAGVAAWYPWAVVLDMAKVRYEWGDEMAQLIASSREPTTIITSPLNRKGLTSLVKCELLQEPAEVLFDSLPDALAGCERLYRAALEEEERTVHDMRKSLAEPIDLNRQAKMVRRLLPNADVRTDQSNVLRVYHGKLLGTIEQMSDGKFHWAIIDLRSDGDIPGCVTGPPVAAGNEWLQAQAAGCLAREMDRIVGG